MHPTDETYQRIYQSQNYRFETSLVVGGRGRLIDEIGDRITFGTGANTVGIYLDSSGQGSADSGYGEHMLINVRTSHRTFSNNVPEVGCCPVGEIDVEMIMPKGEIPRMGLISPFVRLVSFEDGSVSEWIRKGLYYIDTRDNTHNRDELDILRLHGFDAMLKGEVIYTPVGLDFPAKDKAVVQNIASIMGVNVEARTLTLLNKGYDIQLPIQYTMREVLGYIGAMYAGNWIMNDDGELQLLMIYDLPPETNLLMNEQGYRLAFLDSEYGSVRIKIE